jgi:NAD(P)H-nitrite reductase large subunit
MGQQGQMEILRNVALEAVVVGGGLLGVMEVMGVQVEQLEVVVVEVLIKGVQPLALVVQVDEDK